MRKKEPGKFGWLMTLFLIVIALALLGTMWGSIKKARKAGTRTSALSGCKALAGGLVSFKSEYGNYPCDETREQLQKEGKRNIPSGTDANAYLSQLLASGIMDSETYFFCEAGKGYHKADDKMDSAEDILAPGENSYAYVMAEGLKPLTHSASITPIVIAPIVSGGDQPTFDPGLFGEQYVYGAIDGSGKSGRIDEYGQATLKGRDSLFQTGKDSLFGKQRPDVRIPVRKY